MKKYISVALAALLCVIPVVAQAGFPNKLFADRDTVGGTSVYLITNAKPVPAGARLAPANTNMASLTVVWVSGDDCFLNVNPDALPVVSGVYIDRMWVGSTRPVMQFEGFNSQILKAISAGSTVVDWYVTYN